MFVFHKYILIRLINCANALFSFIPYALFYNVNVPLHIAETWQCTFFRSSQQLDFMIKTVEFLNKERIVAFSDGVIAIIITLMVLDIHLPHIAKEASAYEIWHELSTMLPSIVAYGVSFYSLGIFWSNHHHFFFMVKHSDRNLLWLNLNLLFWLSLIPLPTSYLADHYDQPEATTIYGATMLICHFSFGLLVYYASKKNLILDNYSAKTIKKISTMILISCLLWLVSIAAGYYSTYISYGIILAIGIYYFLPQNLELVEEEEESEKA
jgi:uncharacterized membrane protein